MQPVEEGLSRLYHQHRSIQLIRIASLLGSLVSASTIALTMRASERASAISDIQCPTHLGHLGFSSHRIIRLRFEFSALERIHAFSMFWCRVLHPLQFNGLRLVEHLVFPSQDCGRFVDGVASGRREEVQYLFGSEAVALGEIWSKTRGSVLRLRLTV